MKVGIFIILFLFTYGCSNRSEIEYHGLFPVKEYGHWGFIDTNGKKIIECQFDEVQKFSEGLAAVRINKLWGFIDTLGKIVIKPVFVYAEPFSYNLALVGIKKGSITQNAFIKKNGEIAFNCKYENPESFYEGKARVEIYGLISYIDTTGKIIINTYNENGSFGFYDGIMDVYGRVENEASINDSLGPVEKRFTKFYNSAGDMFLELNGWYSQSFSEGLLYLGSKDTYINKNGISVISKLNPDYYYNDFSDGLAKIYKRNNNPRTRFIEKAGFIDKTGTLKIPMKYNVIEDFKEGRAAFYDGIRWGFINKAGDTIIAPRFDEIDYKGFHNGLCWVRRNRAWGYVDRMGKLVWKEEIDIQYKKLDLTKWVLDTIDKKDGLMYGGKTIDCYNPLKKYENPNGEFTFRIFLDTSEHTVYRDHFIAYKLYLINSTSEIIKIPAQSGTIKVIQQALNENNKWVDIEYEFNSFCGNEYYNLLFGPHSCVVVPAPITKGDFETKLRFRLKLLDGTEIYSNEFVGKINTNRFIKNQSSNGPSVFTL